MKYWLVVATLALSVSFASAQERMKIGYIDVQRVIAESQSGKRAKERFQVQVKKAEADVQKERQDLERLKSDLLCRPRKHVPADPLVVQALGRLMGKQNRV